MHPSPKNIAHRLSKFDSPVVVMTVGIPGSGKSTVVEQINEYLEWPILRSDGIRAELTGSESDLSQDETVWQLLEERALAYIESGQSFFVDATHNTLFSREFGSRSYRFMGANAIIALRVNVPVDLAIKRNDSRERSVPQNAILRMGNNLKQDPVSIANGFDEVITVSNE